MTDLRMMATMLAQEMVEHNLKNGVQVLDKEYIAHDACELAYLIDKNIRSYEGVEPLKGMQYEKSEDPKPHQA